MEKCYKSLVLFNILIECPSFRLSSNIINTRSVFTFLQGLNLDPFFYATSVLPFLLQTPDEQGNITKNNKQRFHLPEYDPYRRDMIDYVRFFHTPEQLYELLPLHARIVLTRLYQLWGDVIDHLHLYRAILSTDSQTNYILMRGLTTPKKFKNIDERWRTLMARKNKYPPRNKKISPVVIIEPKILFPSIISFLQAHYEINLTEKTPYFIPNMKEVLYHHKPPYLILDTHFYEEHRPSFKTDRTVENKLNVIFRASGKILTGRQQQQEPTTTNTRYLNCFKKGFTRCVKRGNINIFDKNKVITVQIQSKYLGTDCYGRHNHNKNTFVKDSTSVFVPPIPVTFSRCKTLGGRSMFNVTMTGNKNVDFLFVRKVMELSIQRKLLFVDRPTVVPDIFTIRNNCATIDSFHFGMLNSGHFHTGYQMSFKDLDTSNNYKEALKINSFPALAVAAKTHDVQLYRRTFNTTDLFGEPLVYNVSKVIDKLATSELIEYDVSLARYKSRVESRIGNLLSSTASVFLDLCYYKGISVDDITDTFVFFRNSIVNYQKFSSFNNKLIPRILRHHTENISLKYKIPQVARDHVVDRNRLVRLARLGVDMNTYGKFLTPPFNHKPVMKQLEKRTANFVDHLLHMDNITAEYMKQDVIKNCLFCIYDSYNRLGAKEAAEVLALIWNSVMYPAP